MALQYLAGAQSGNTRMKQLVCGIPHREDQKPAALLGCPRTQEMTLLSHLLLVLPFQGHLDKLPKVFHLYSLWAGHEGHVTLTSHFLMP